MAMADTKPASVTANSRPTQISPLPSLPRELQDMIIDDVESRQDLSALSKTCLRLREAVLPFLFRNVTLLGNQYIIHFLRALSASEDSRLADVIRTLELRPEKHYSDPLVLELIQSIPKLTRLEIYCTFDYTEPEPADSYATYASVTPLSSALTCVKDTLEHLKVGADLVIEDTELGVGTVTDFCSLKQLRCLQTVEIPFFVLLGRGPERPKLADVLPPSLRSLKFGDDVWPVHPLDFNQSLMMGKFVEFFGAGAWKETTPLLESVILSLCGYDQAFEDMRSREWRPNRGEREFRKLCTENGLQCEVLRYNSYNGRSEYRNVYIYDE